LELGVGQDEEAFTFVRRANFRRREKSCLTLVAHCSQVSPNIVEGESKMAADVFEEDVCRPALRDNSCDLGPEPSGVALAEALPSGGHGGAGVSSSDEMNDSTPASAVEGSEVIPDRRFIQESVLHACRQDRGSIGVPFRITDSPVGISEGQLDSELHASDPGAEGKASDGT